MKLEIITIGNELLIGQVVDTNSAWIGQELNLHGFELSRITSIEDTSGAIVASLNEALLRSDVVLLTGGLGPTKDDITKETLASYFDSKLVFNQKVFDNISLLLKGRVKNINDLNRSQAFVPENCIPLDNPIGTAPIMWFNQGEKIVVSMPGVPSEMKEAMRSQVIPRLKERFESQNIIHKTILVFNIPEAVLAEQLSHWEQSIPDYMSLAYLPSPGRVRLRLTAKTRDEEQAQFDFSRLIEDLRALLGENIYGEDDLLVQQMLGNVLKDKGKTLALAESCTGGYIGHLITSVAGSSAYFKGGIVAYDNNVKLQHLHVNEDDLNEKGAVSQEVVEQMARGVRKILNADYAVATSGIAGPDGGTEEKPVGTVWIAIAGDFGVESQVFSFGRLRERNIQRAAEMGLIMLLQRINKAI